MHADVDQATLRIDREFRDGKGSIDLSNLRLTTLPLRLADLPSLTELNLSNNQLTEVRTGSLT
ncbi:MAG: leucine-rich repeat domain-containing protein [Pseudonocardiaceae bacterium]